MLPTTPVPEDLATLLDPDWLTGALADVGPGERVVAVVETGTVATLASKVRFVATVEGTDGTRRELAYCIKAHLGGGPETLATEARVYRELRPRLAMRAPTAAYVGLDDASGRAVLILDDIVGRGGRLLGALEPYPVEVCRDTLGQLAVLHAATWGDARWDVDWLAPRIDRSSARYSTADLQAFLDDGRAADLPASVRDAPALQAALAATAALAPTCVIHGDTHSGNAYLDAEGRGAWYDFQITQRGHWSVDVAYHLAAVLSVDDRRAHEAELLDHYLAALVAEGVDAPDRAEAWDRYTLGGAWGYFLWTITRVTAREIVLAHVPRIGTALADHDTLARLAAG